MKPGLVVSLAAAGVLSIAGAGTAHAGKKKPSPAKPAAPAQPAAPATQPAAPATQPDAPATQPTAPTAQTGDEEQQPVVPATTVPEYEGQITDPNTPDVVRRQRDKGAQGPVVRYGKDDYPIELVRRPITLAAEQAQVALDMPFVYGDGHPTLTQILLGRFGVTRDLELSLEYGVGLERLSSETGQNGFEAGKAFQVGAAYTIVPQLVGAEVGLAFLADPDFFGVALEVGVPFKLEIADKWAFFTGRNLLRVKLKGLPVDPADPTGNLAQAALHGAGAGTSAGRLQIDLGVLYQAAPELAVFGTFGVGWLDFSTMDQPFSLFAGVSYTVERTIDLGARVGWYRLDEPAASFSLGVFAAARL
jgi:hypothetical protein